MTNNSVKTSIWPFATLISVFFFWGFVAASNDILIPVFKKALNLEQWQSQMVSFAFYVAYTVGSILYLIISKVRGGDLLMSLGYKKGIALGLIISALGTLLFIPAANTESFGLMISGLFIVGLGFSLQQTAANPLAINMGDPARGSQRLSMAGGINNMGTTIGPILISLAIFGSVSSGNTEASIESIKIPYLLLGGAFVAVAILFMVSAVPNQIASSTEIANSKSPSTERSSVMKYPQLVFGMIAVFVYVGVEVSSAGNLSEFLKQYMGKSESEVAPFVSLFWASLMIGRWTSAAGVFSSKKSIKTILGVVMPYLAFILFLAISSIVGHDIRIFYPYAGVILIMIAAEIASKGNPSKQLLYFSSLGIAALLVGILSTNPLISTFAFISVGLFCSTLWPCIFTLAIAGLGKKTNDASAYLIMMICGGGFISLLQGAVSDTALGIKWSYLVGVCCFAYLAYYAIFVNKELKKQGVSLDNSKAAAH
ncbi:MAG: MFS transporter [Flavobacteriales bacterium]